LAVQPLTQIVLPIVAWVTLRQAQKLELAYKRKHG
jgi:hypothetical protein